jgi:hypothetical protein
MLKIKTIDARDRAKIYQIMQQDNTCKSGEIEATLHRIDLYLFDVHQRLYMIIKAEDEKKDLLGYAVFGADPNAAHTYHVYNLAKSQLVKSNGILIQLLDYIENEVSKKKGRIIYGELSSHLRDKNHYEIFTQHQYQLSSKIENFYSEGEHKLILFKNLIL